MKEIKITFNKSQKKNLIRNIFIILVSLFFYVFDGGKLPILFALHFSFLKNRIKEINSLDLNDIDFISDDGSIEKIDENIISDFRYTGLNNIEFIYTDFYKNGFENFINK